MLPLPIRRRLAAGFLLSLATLGTLTGCGGSATASNTSADSGSATTGASRHAPSGARSAGALKLAADPTGRLRYRPAVLRAKSSNVTIDFVNRSPLPHNLTIASRAGKVLGATPTFVGGSTVLTIRLKPGTYTFYCTVPGHRAAGMQGKLVVR